MGIYRAVTHARLGSQMDHAPWLGVLEQGFHAVAIGDIEPHVLKCNRGGEPGQTRALEFDVVVVAEIVDADDFVPAVQEPLADRGADEPRGPRDQHLHGGVPFPESRLTPRFRKKKSIAGCGRRIVQ